MLTAGADSTIRYFDVREPSDSYRISAPDMWPYGRAFASVMCNAVNANGAVVFEEATVVDAAAEAALCVCAHEDDNYALCMCRDSFIHFSSSSCFPSLFTFIRILLRPVLTGNRRSAHRRRGHASTRDAADPWARLRTTLTPSPVSRPLSFPRPCWCVLSARSALVDTVFGRAHSYAFLCHMVAGTNRFRYRRRATVSSKCGRRISSGTIV